MENQPQPAPTGQLSETLQTPPPKRSFLRRHGKILWLLLILVIAAILGDIVVTSQLKSRQLALSPTPQPTLAPTQSPTANWKTYTNAKYGYSIQYPSEQFINCNEASDEFLLFDGNACARGEQFTEIYILPKPSPYKPVQDSDCVKNTIEKVTINGIPATKYSRQISNDTNIYNLTKATCNPANGYKQDSFVYYNIEHNGQIFEIAVLLSTKPEIKNQILSTLTFTWKTYTSKDKSFSFQYPPSWKDDTRNSGIEVLLTAPASPECEPPSGCGGGLTGVSVDVLANPKALPLQNFIAEDKQNKLNRSIFSKNASDLGISKEWVINRKAPGGGPGQEVLIANGTKVIDLYCGNCNNETVDQIISTFKFTN